MKTERLILAALILFGASSHAAVTFGRDKLRDTTRTVTFTADQNRGLQLERHTRVDFAGKFSLEIDGVAVTGVKLVDGLQHDTEVIEYKDGEDIISRPNSAERERGTVTLIKDATNSQQLQNWRQTVIDGKVDRKSISIIFHNDAGEESMRINLFDCYPTKWTGPSLNSKNSGHATEALELVCERMEMK